MILNLDEIGQTLETMLNKSANEWTLHDIQLYQLFENKLKKYRRTFIEAQFRQDQADIIDNIIEQKWYRESTVQPCLNYLLKQMKICTYSLLRRPDQLLVQLVIRFPESGFDLKLHFTQKVESADQHAGEIEYYLYLENHDTGQKAYIAKNHPTIPVQSKIPELELIYQDFLDSESMKVPAGQLMKLISELILFFDETKIVISAPLSRQSNWTLAESLSH